MSLDQFDLGMLAVLGIYVAAYLMLLVRRRGASYPEREGADPSNDGWAGVEQ